jgi:type III secretion protein J
MSSRLIGVRRWQATALGLLALLLVGCDDPLYSNLDEREANEMLAILLQHDIGADRTRAKDGTVTISVSKSQLADAVTLLKERGYPRQRYASVADVFPGDSLISSPLQERARLNYALSQELSHTISDIDGVLSARVHIVLPENDRSQKESAPSSASVFIRHARAVPLEPVVPQIKTLIANSVPGVVYDRVTVVLVPVDGPPTVHPAEDPAVKVGGLLEGGQGGPFWLLGAIGAVAVVGSGAYVHRRNMSRRSTVKLDAG